VDFRQKKAISQSHRLPSRVPQSPNFVRLFRVRALPGEPGNGSKLRLLMQHWPRLPSLLHSHTSAVRPFAWRADFNSDRQGGEEYEASMEGGFPHYCPDNSPSPGWARADPYFPLDRGVGAGMLPAVARGDQGEPGGAGRAAAVSSHRFSQYGEVP
jgi:hypothetical protein